MGIKPKHVVIGLGVLGVGFLYANKKIEDWSKTMVKLIPIPSNFRNFSLKNWVLNFTLDVTIHNPTSEDFNPNGLIATLKRIEIKTLNDVLIAKINVNKNSIRIPANGKYTVKDLVVELDTHANLLNALALSKIRSLDDVKTDAVIGILGKEYIISQ